MDLKKRLLKTQEKTEATIIPAEMADQFQDFMDLDICDIRNYSVEEWSESGNDSCEHSWLCEPCARQLEMEGYVVISASGPGTRGNCEGHKYGLRCEASKLEAA